MASSTYWNIFQDIIDLTSLSNTYADSSNTTRLIKTAIMKAEKRALENTEGYDKETTSTFTTTAGTATYAIPTWADRVKKMYVTISSRRYYLWADRFLEDIAFDRLQTVQTVRSDIPQYWTIQNNQIVIYPAPNTSSLVYTVTQNNIPTSINISPSSSADQNTVCSIKEGFEDMLVFKWCSAVFRQREQWDLVRQYDADYKELYAEFWNKVSSATSSPLIKWKRTSIIDPTRYPNTLTKS